MGFLLGHLYKAALAVIPTLTIPTGIVPELKTDRGLGLLRVKIGIRLYIIGELQIQGSSKAKIIQHVDDDLPAWFTQAAIQEIYRKALASDDIVE